MADDQKKPAGAPASARKRGKPPARARAGELWAKCPECRMPVKDAELFRHLLKCPGADARQAQWAAEQAKTKPEQNPTPEEQAG